MSFHAFVDIAISQPCSCFHNNIFTFSSESSFHSKSLIDNDRRLASSFSWKSITSTKKVGKNINFGRSEVHRGGLIIKAVATLEIANIACKNEELKQYRNTLSMDIDSIRSNAYLCESQASGEDSTEVDERRRLRRSIISKANKGNTPWNKGKKHSPETLQRIKERTRMAMQDPKIKMKLVNSGHAQSEETRIKIGVGVRLRWERRREKLMLQETCYYEWKKLIAAASRKGLLGEEELKWDSYHILNKQHEKEWHQSVELRKIMSRPRGSKRAPKSAEQKRKIAAAIAAKWADPETCYYEWKKLIASASRKGLRGEEELQWDSYKILNKQHDKERHQSVELRKIMSTPIGSKRAPPKSAEQKRKIAAAIAAKWADPKTCYYEWKKLIAEASRKGLLGEEELQWDSYNILNKQHEKERHQSVELRKIMSRPNGSKRAPPKSAERKRKIAAAIAAKWADPETCYYEWKKLIAEASRKGLLGEEELQWDSYNILKKQHEKEWHQSIELRKIMSRPKGSKRATMSAEQKRKIAAAIAAKWADPQYRDRVSYGLAKYHGIPRKKPSIDGQTRKTSTRKKIESDDLAKHETKNQIIRLKKSNTPLYKDPLASSKLEMLKNIRAQRDATINKKSEAISRAKLLIAEAEKAATALEIAAKSSTLAQASLLESRELISEAISFIKLMENEYQVPRDLSESITEPVLQQTRTHTQILSSSDGDSEDLSFHTYALSDTVNENATNSCYGDLVKTGEKSCQTSSDGFLPQKSINNVHCTNATMNLADPKRNPNGIASHGKISLVNGVEKNIQSGKAEGPQKQVNKTKIWVCGRLVEVEEQT